MSALTDLVAAYKAIFTTSGLNVDQVADAFADAILDSFHPLVFCSYKNQVVTTPGAALRYTTINKDVLNTYNPSNGRFIAPVGGLYLMTGCTWQSVSGTQLYPQLSGGSVRVVAGMGVEGSHRMPYAFQIEMLASQYLTMHSSGTTVANADDMFEISLIRKI